MDYSDFNINIPFGKTTGEVAVLCPQCSHTRKKSKDKCLSVNLDKKVWNCNHCHWHGFLKATVAKIEYKIPEWRNKTVLSDGVVKFFEKRKVSQNTLKTAKISYGTEWMPKTGKDETVIEFNYFRLGQLVNIKYRDKSKNFKLFKDAELIFYNLDSILESDRVFIVEGEMDCLAMIEAGYTETISVPNGANQNSNNLIYLDNCYDEIISKKEIILCLDNDINGRKLKHDLAERLGFDRCKYVEFKDCKDANECLVKYGIQGIIESVVNPKEFPIEGVYTIADISNEIDDMYQNGLDKGVSVNVDGFDLNFVKGYLTVITGIPSHGKSNFLDFLLLRLRSLHNWKGVFYSPENRPIQLHFSKMARLLTAKNWDGFNRLTLYELKEIKDYLQDYFWFLKPEKDFSLTSILTQIKLIKQRYGIDFFVIDAWNKLDHKDNDTSYVGKCLDEITMFCEINNVHCFLVAHPTKIQKKKDGGGVFEIPTMYDVSGSANFYNKADSGICVYRNFENKTVTVQIQKVKFEHWGNTGEAEFKYDESSKRYYRDKIDLSNWMQPKKKQTLFEELTSELNNNGHDEPF